MCLLLVNKEIGSAIEHNQKNNLLPDLLSLAVGLRGGKRPVALVVTFD